MGGEFLGEPLGPVPDRKVVPEEPVFFIGDGADPLLTRSCISARSILVIIDGLLRSPEGDDQGQVEKGVKGGERRGAVYRRVQDRLPEPLALDGEPPHLLDPIVIELLSADLSRKAMYSSICAGHNAAPPR